MYSPDKAAEPGTGQGRHWKPGLRPQYYGHRRHLLTPELAAFAASGRALHSNSEHLTIPGPREAVRGLQVFPL